MADDSEYITPFCEGDEEEINSMYNEVFGFDRSMEEWRWKFRNHPLPELTMISKLVQKGRIIGHIGSLPGRFKIGDQVVHGGQIVDYVIHPSFQLGKRSTLINQELNTSMKDAFVDHGIAFGYGFPNALSYPLAMKYLRGAEDVMEVPIWKKSLRPPPVADTSGPGRARLRSLYARGMWHLRETARRRLPGLDADCALHPLPAPDERLDVLWKESSRHIGSAGVRDARYLQWRFFDKPGKTYSFWILEKRGEPAAYAVTSIKDRAGTPRTAHIVDILFRPGRGILESLIRGVIERMAQNRVDVVKCLAVSDSTLARSLEKSGFEPEPQGVKMIAWLLTPSIDRSFFFDSRQWHITYADLDGT